MGSRKLIRKLSLELKIKVFALVDCDPHGMEIAAIVRWGSFGQANLARCTEAIYAKELIVPDMVYLGLLPSDINRLGLNNYSIPMSPLDLKKLDSLTERLTGQVRHRMID
jgi:DNA topoisomerase VI subunit A